MSHLPEHILILNIQNNYNSAGATPTGNTTGAPISSDRGGGDQKTRNYLSKHQQNLLAQRSHSRFSTSMNQGN